MTPLEEAIDRASGSLSLYERYNKHLSIAVGQTDLRLLLDAATLVANFVKAASEPTINPENLSTAKGID